MKLLFKQRLFSWLDSYDIYNEQQETIFTVRGKLSFGHRLEIYDAMDKHIGTLNQQLLTFLPKFEIYIGQQRIGQIVKEFTFFRPSFSIDFNDWRVEGDLFQWDYDILDRTGVIATIEKQLFRLTDTYVIDVKNDADALLALMVVLAIDAIKCNEKK